MTGFTSPSDLQAFLEDAEDVRLDAPDGDGHVWVHGIVDGCELSLNLGPEPGEAMLEMVRGSVPRLH